MRLRAPGVVLVLLSGAGGASAKPTVTATMPIKVTASKRIGRLLSPAVLPLDGGKAPTLFWAGADLCAVQEESPPRFMRCYSTAAGRWKERTPLALPAVDGRALKTWIARASEICPTGEVVAFAGPELVPDSCGIEAQSVLAIVAGPALLLEDSASAEKRPPMVARLERGKKDASPIPAAGATASTAGSRLVGGCCRLAGPDRLRVLGDDRKDWPLGPPPPGKAWRAALASPDQQWIAAQASADGEQAQELWLMRVEKR